MILDVGCGENPRGDVNVDFKVGGDYGVRKTKANLIASVYFLPFKNNAFDSVVFYGLLHHLTEPEKGWHEMLRVSRGIVAGLEPNFNLIYPRDRTEPYHTFRKRQLISATRSDSHYVSLDRVLSLRHGPCVDFRITAWKKPYKLFEDKLRSIIARQDLS